ncbi:early nodulin-like protein 1 [Fagus crenata]|uniref:Phytocyanin domain-containing protein n=1 Tax=Fagus sylvatica TaxID=28930 RepID=A0A2N9GQP3_FAGSY
MARRGDSFILSSMLVLVVVAALFGCSYGCKSGCPSRCPPAVQYQVGDSVWSIPQFPNYYTNWSSSHFFRTGDSLRFEFERGYNDVIQVSRQEYERCTGCNPYKVLKDGPAIVPLTQKGVFYFISNFSNYCALGLKVSVKVHECSTRSPQTPLPSPSPLPIPPSSPPAQPPVTRNGSNPSVPDISPAPSPYAYSPEAGAPTYKSMASALRRFGTSSPDILFGWAFGLCLVVFTILG